MTRSSHELPPSRRAVGAAQRLFDAIVADRGHVVNLTRVGAHVPELKVGLFGLIDTAAKAASLTVRQRAVLISACASTLGDSYCALAWGTKLAVTVDPSVVAEVLGGDDGGLPPDEQALAGGTPGGARPQRGDARGCAGPARRRLRRRADLRPDGVRRLSAGAGDGQPRARRHAGPRG
ncbi:MAG TPA: hypothetical protein VJM33_03410 [Microthrixaceae bacterium]|nr:hypothetical protein [Microthrixaceae bacterium]